MKGIGNKLLLLLGVAILLGGCTTFDNQSFWEVSYVNADFEAGNFKTTRLGIQGTASLSMLFGMGNTGIALGSSDLLKQCMDEVHSQYPMLGKSALLHNINVEHVSIGIPGIYLKHTVSITADVVEFNDEYLDYRKKP
jgi:hypothetical protein